jgi:hypothetical protein
VVRCEGGRYGCLLVFRYSCGGLGWHKPQVASRRALMHFSFQDGRYE